jgi:hypothetical protein
MSANVSGTISHVSRLNPDTGAMKYVIARDIGKFSIDGKVVNLRIQK